jgi:predicted AlkP superfamily pyrophosphatase or phosphodiesterase
MFTTRTEFHRSIRAVSTAGMLGLVAVSSAHSQGSPERRRPVSLVVVITVDQMRGDYFARYSTQYTGGFARIAARAALFPRAVQDHANTETAPGHSTILSGRTPAHTGIVSNDRGVPDPLSPLVDYAGPAASPSRFNGTTLVDWLHAADPASRVLSVSRKDRGAILPVGRAKGSVYWWANGAFTTSRYYADTLPTWVKAFNNRRSAEALAGTTWDLLLPASAYAEPDSMFFENNGADFVFPHLLPKSADAMRAQLANYPWMDSVTMAFALDGARTLELGRRGATDVLAVSLSTLDQVGHAYGPDSRELHDHLLRVDRWLGAFLDSLAGLVPGERTVFVLTGDHGVASFPEYTAMVKHKSASRVSLDGLARETAAVLRERFEMDFGFDFNGNGLLIADTASMRARGMSIDSLASALAAKARSAPGVIAVYTPRSLATAPPTDLNAMRWRHAIPKEIPWLFCGVLKPGYVWSPGRQIAEHGTMSDETVSVPIAFWGAGVVPHLSHDRPRTVDIAPTLAAFLGVKPSEPLDGKVLPGVFTNAAGRKAGNR